MSIAAASRSPVQAMRATVWVFVTLAGASCGLTLLYLGMRAVMDIGGACGSGGPYVPSVQCPEGVPLLIVAGVWGGLIFVGLYSRSTSKHGVPTLVAFAWPALFLSLGWNFFDYGIDPPAGEGLVWGWLVCAALFAVVGGVPLFAMAGPVMSRFGHKAPESVSAAQVLIPTRSRVKELRHTSKKSRGSSQRFGFDPPPKGPAEGGGPTLDALERLSALHASGALSEGEFEAAKRRVLEGEA